MKCGLLGEKLGHSYSPQIHQKLGDYSYTLFEKSSREIESFLIQRDFDGLNVTIPYKKSVIPYLSDLSPIAKKLGAVNTIVKRADGHLVGHNTDYFGLQFMLRNSGLTVSGKKALVLGSGGASNTAVAVLEELGANVVVISRNGENNYKNLHKHRDASIVLNATPVGMYPNVGMSPVELDIFPFLEGVFDLIFNPAHTKLLIDAEQRGIPAVNGLLMLVAQAKESAEWFTGKKIPDETILPIYQQLKHRMENIILIGMPGCGKTTIARELGKTLNRKVIDADTQLVADYRMPITDIFSTQGEVAFRTMETAVLSQLGKQSGIIISTGGGCVTQAENYPHLHQNGTIFWICRSIDQLPTDGRPISQANSLTKLYTNRKPLYEAFADHRINNVGSIADAVSQIIKILEDQI